MCQESKGAYIIPETEMESIWQSIMRVVCPSSMLHHYP